MDAHHLVQVNKNPNIPEFRAGDTVQVNYKVREGERTRTQPFLGVVIRRMGGKSPAAGFTVRRVTRGFGVERTFPLYSPHIESVQVQRYGKVRRAKLYYLRERQGRAARIKEQTNLPAWLKASNAAMAASAVAAAEALLVEELVEEVTEDTMEAAEVDAAEAQETVDEAPADDAQPRRHLPTTRLLLRTRLLTRPPLPRMRLPVKPRPPSPRPPKNSPDPTALAARRATGDALWLLSRGGRMPATLKSLSMPP